MLYVPNIFIVVDGFFSIKMHLSLKLIFLKLSNCLLFWVKTLKVLNNNI